MRTLNQTSYVFLSNKITVNFHNLEIELKFLWFRTKGQNGALLLWPVSCLSVCLSLYVTSRVSRTVRNELQTCLDIFCIMLTQNLILNSGSQTLYFSTRILNWVEYTKINNSGSGGANYTVFKQQNILKTPIHHVVCKCE